MASALGDDPDAQGLKVRRLAAGGEWIRTSGTAARESGISQAFRASRPTSDPLDNTLTKVGVDATKPGGVEFAERLTIADEQRARVRGIRSASGIRI